MPRPPDTYWFRQQPYILADQQVIEFLGEQSSRLECLSPRFIFYKIQRGRFLLDRESSKLYGKEEHLLGLLEALNIGLPIYF
jgi:hypothetical protein